VNRAASQLRIAQVADRASARIGVEFENLAKGALERRSWVRMPERQRNAKKSTAKTMPWKEQKTSRAPAF
jgi:hypothetical protein